MRIHRVATDSAKLMQPHGDAWDAVPLTRVNLVPAPVELVRNVSPYLAESSGHGVVQELSVKLAHDGLSVSIRLEWRSDKLIDTADDLDQFVDAAAVMLTSNPMASAISMGAPGAPVNAWFWKADRPSAMDIIAEGYATTERRPASMSGLEVVNDSSQGVRSIVLQRSLKVAEPSCVQIEPGSGIRLAIAIWSGANNERSAQKAISGEFVDVKVDA